MNIFCFSEILDGEIAQEIQEKLVIEAELKRMQEEKDEVSGLQILRIFLFSFLQLSV